MESQHATYPSGEPKDMGLAWVCLGYMVLCVLFITSFIGYGHGSALSGIILLATRLLLMAVIPGGIIVAIIAFRRKAIDVAIAALVAIPLAVIAIILLAPL